MFAQRGREQLRSQDVNDKVNALSCNKQEYSYKIIYSVRKINENNKQVVIL